MGTIEHEYSRNFHVRSNMKLENFLEREGFESLNDLLHNHKA